MEPEEVRPDQAAASWAGVDACLILVNLPFAALEIFCAEVSGIPDAE